MKSELFVDVQPAEITIALTEDGKLQEVGREKVQDDNFAVGNIYLGRVRKIMPALNAAFVDVGHEKDAFLHYLDLGPQFDAFHRYTKELLSDRRRMPSIPALRESDELTKEGQIADKLHVGDLLLVQVIKEPISTKGPRLTAEINLTGRNMVLLPFANKVMLSQKIHGEAERGRLRQLLQAIKPQGFGVIVRTVAKDKRAAELDSESRLLVKRWEDAIRSLQQDKKAIRSGNGAKQGRKDADVRLVSAEIGRTIGTIRDVFSPDFANIQINDEEMYEEVRQYVELIAPEKSSIVKLYKGDEPMFDKYDITRQLKSGLGRVVGFGNGGYLTMDKTEALFSIDVNSGSKRMYEDQEQNAFQFNMLAADEVAHQLRLRDIGGIIVIDFIDMESKDNQQALYDHVRKLLEQDRAKHNVLPLSKFCLMQITRQRVRPAVEMDVTEVCPTCMGKGRVQPSLLFTESLQNDIELYVSHYGKGLRLEIHPFVYAYVSKGWLGSIKSRWRRHYGVRVVENQSLGMLERRFTSADGKPLSIDSEEKQ